MKPGPRVYDGPQIKTSVRIIGPNQVDEFEALCVLLGRRRHELAADFVLDGIRAAREDPQLAEAVRLAVDARRRHQAEQEQPAPDNVVDLDRWRP
jgi:hypothetical protein